MFQKAYSSYASSISSVCDFCQYPFQKIPLPYGSEACELGLTSHMQHVDQPEGNYQKGDQADDGDDGVQQRSAHQAAAQVQAL
jgi:hypothetical protein